MKYRHPVLIITSLFVFFSISGQQTRNSYNVVDFGAKGDGITINTRSINQAIRKCHEGGGGRVIIPPGTYISGTIVLLSNVNLHLEYGSVIMGSKDTADYSLLSNPVIRVGTNRRGLIYASRQRNISITGDGELNGNGMSFMESIEQTRPIIDFDRKAVRQGQEYMKDGTLFEEGPLSYDIRPGKMIVFEYCDRIHIESILIKDSPLWAILFGSCNDVLVRGITIDNSMLIPNNDGIHCTSSQNVRITDCHISAGDDAICVAGVGPYPTPDDIAKTGITPEIGNKSGYSENVTVSNCVLSSRSTCIRVGFGLLPIRNLVFSNIVMHASNRGIGIFSRHNSSIENVCFSNIIINTQIYSGQWWGNGEPVHISAIKNQAGGNAGKIKNIRFSNLILHGESGVLIWGDPESIIEDIFFNQVQLTIHAGKHVDTYGGNFDLRPAFPKELRVFGHDIPGLFARYVRNLVITGFDLKWDASLPGFYTNGIEIRNFEKVYIDDYRGQPAHKEKGQSAICLVNGKDVEISNCRSRDNSDILMLKDVVF